MRLGGITQRVCLCLNVVCFAYEDFLCPNRGPILILWAPPHKVLANLLDFLTVLTQRERKRAWQIHTDGDSHLFKFQKITGNIGIPKTFT